MSHAKFAPSAASRWLKCAAAPSLEQGLEDTTSDAADTGTCYHAVAAIMLLRLTTPRLAADAITTAELTKAHRLAYESIKVYGTENVAKETARRLMKFPDSKLHALGFARYALETFGEAIANGAPFGIESRVSMSFLGYGSPVDCYGTIDFWCFVDGTAHVLDLKCGRYSVSPEENPQLMLYASGVRNGVDGCGYPHTIELVIFQHGAPSYAEVSTDEIKEFINDASRAVELASQPSPPATAGDWCTFCKAKPTCPAYNAHGLALAQNDFAPVAEAPLVFALKEMSGDALADLLDKGDQLKRFMEIANEVATERAYKGDLVIPGYKVIRSTTRKKWKDETVAYKVLGRTAGKRTVLTPTQCIKKFGEEKCADLWAQPEGAVKLVPVAARGAAISGSAKNDFSDQE